MAGGVRFTISLEAILDALEIEYGIVREGEASLLKFVEAYPDKERILTVPGLVWSTEGRCIINQREPYRFEMGTSTFTRDSGFMYAFETTDLPIQIKRGCNQRCSYCVEPIIEGKRFIFRQLDEGLHDRLSFASQSLPGPFDSEFAALLADAWFCVILTGDSFSDEILERNHISYRESDIIRAIELCEIQRIPYTVAMIFRFPGETDGSLGHSLALAFLMDRTETDQVVHSFLRTHIGVWSRSFEYLLRKLSKDGRTTEARILCDQFLDKLTAAEAESKLRYRDGTASETSSKVKRDGIIWGWD